MAGKGGRFQMRARKQFKYRLFRATTGAVSFWRWEVYPHQGGDPTESGVVYGSMERAKGIAMAAIDRLSMQDAGCGPPNSTRA
jgi:hypothetical protein